MTKESTNDEPTSTDEDQVTCFSEDPSTSFEYVAEERYWVSADQPTPWVKGKEILGPFEGTQRQTEDS
jgi:hypothetical protein